MKKYFILPFVLLFTAVTTIELVFGHSSQPQAAKSGAPGENNCTQCHSGTLNSGTGSVSILFNSGQNEYVQGSTYPITVTVTDGVLPRKGFQLTALSGGTGPTRGTFALTNTTTTSLQTGTVGGAARQWVGHKAANTSVSTWTFNWTAPTNISSPITFYVAGNATNNANNSSGDKVYTSTLTITMAPPPPPVASFSANATSFCPTATTTFTDNSSGTVTSRLWSFPGGTPSTSTAIVQSVQYGSPGQYDVQLIVTNAGGSDTILQSNFITVYPEPTLSATSSNVLCTGGSTGSIDLSVFGTTGNTFFWSNGSTQEDPTGLAPGTYSVTVQSGDGCASIASYTVSDAPAIALSTGATLAGCTVPSGTATVNASGGAGGFTYLWSNTGTTASISGLPAGAYVVTATDANGCEAVDSTTVGITSPPLLGTSTTLSACGQGTGSATATASAGTPGYTYLWSNGDTTSTTNGLFSGPYSVTVTDANGCTETAIANVFNSDGPTASPIVVPVSCNGLSDGSINAVVTGGQAPYTFIWSNGDTLASSASLSAGVYSLSITDSLGCTGVASIQVTEPDPISVNASSTPFTGLLDGSASASPTGGNGGYTYLWSTGGTTATITNLFAGIYFVTVTDQLGCMGFGNVVVVSTVGTSPTLPTQLVLSPMPFHDFLKVDMGIENIESMRLRLFDLQGRVYLHAVGEAGSPILRLNTAELPVGVYFLEVEMGGTKQVLKVLKQ